MKNGLFTIFCLLIKLNLAAQSITYSRSIVKARNIDITYMVANVGINHHMLVLSPNSNSQVHIFNNLLEKINTTIIPARITEEENISVIPYKDQYFLYLNIPNSRKNRLWKINATGEVEDLIAPFTRLLDSLFPGSNGTLKIAVVDDEIFLLSHMMYGEMKKVITTQVCVNSKMEIISSRKVAYSYSRDEETLQHIRLLDSNNLLVLKSGIENDFNRVLKVLKINIPTAEETTAKFNVGTHYIYKPYLYTTPRDTSIIVYCQLRSSANNDPRQANLMFARVNKNFDSVSPISISKYSSAENFLLINDYVPKWLNLARDGGRSYRVSSDNSNSNSPRFNTQSLYDEQLLWRSENNSNIPVPSAFFSDGGPMSALASSRRAGTIKLSKMDHNFKNTADSMLMNSDINHQVSGGEYAQLFYKNTQFLLLKQLFREKSKGLVLFYSGGKKFKSRDLLVNTKYDYLLNQAKESGNSLLLPYTHRQQVGIVRITMDESVIN